MLQSTRKKLDTAILSITLHIGVGTTKAAFDFPLGLTPNELKKAMDRLPETVHLAKKTAEQKEQKSGTLRYKYTEGTWKLSEKAKRTTRTSKRKS